MRQLGQFSQCLSIIPLLPLSTCNLVAIGQVYSVHGKGIGAGAAGRGGGAGFGQGRGSASGGKATGKRMGAFMK